MTYDSILKDIYDRKYANVYFLHGNEAYFIDKISDALSQTVLNESEKAFNLMIFYGKDIDFKNVIDECRQYPMMAGKRLVIIKEAQDMKTLTELSDYIENPSSTSILVVCYKHKKLDKRTKFAKLIDKNALVFEAKALYENQLPQWITANVNSRGFKIETQAVAVIGEYVGTDLGRVSSEIDKLCTGREKTSTITEVEVKEQIGISKDFSIFDLQNAIAHKNIVKSNLIIRYFIDNPKSNPSVLSISLLHSFFYKVFVAQAYQKESDLVLQRMLGLAHAMHLKDFRMAAKNYSQDQIKLIFKALKDADLHSKGMGTGHTGEAQIYMDLLIAVFSGVERVKIY